MKILLLSNNEVCYNARLLKAADYLSEKGMNVTVFNPITGIASPEVYTESIRNKKWSVIENDITKRSFKSKIKWLQVSVLNKIIALLWSKLNLKIGFKYYMNKGLLLAPKEIYGKYDFILIHLVDNLPFAVKLKKQTGAKIIYDSQEYFKGQYNKYESPLKKWVHYAEPKYIKDIDILIATTNVMVEKLKKEYNLTIPCIRVRNLPSKLMLKSILPTTKETSNEVTKLVWHGMAIYFNNTRGVHILLQAVANCKSNVHLYLQGLITQEQKEIFNQYVNELNLAGKVTLVPPANPYNIVTSLTGYDIGLIGELPEEENQMLTSSNKLFDYINAGLAVIASDLPGLNETIKEYEIGYTYPSGNYQHMAVLIDKLAFDKIELKKIKEKSSTVSSQELFWENDYEAVWKEIKKYA